MNMAKKSDITVIIPVHELDDSTKQYFDNAVKSVKDQIVTPDELLIVVPANSDVEKYVSDFDYGDLTARVVKNDGATDFASQVNLGVEESTTGWFSILEFDDEYSKIWLKNAVQYREVYDDVEIFLPIVIDVNTDGAFLGLTNEAVWASQVSDEMGILDNGTLLKYENFNFDGMVMNKETYQDMGGIKASMKLSFIYEFLLRVTYFSTRVMVVPKFGYKHVNQRPDSIFHSYQDKEGGTALTPDEARWWMSLAKKECFHQTDRNITYDKE
jgi:hypothetical protein